VSEIRSVSFTLAILFVLSSITSAFSIFYKVVVQCKQHSYLVNFQIWAIELVQDSVVVDLCCRVFLRRVQRSELLVAFHLLETKKEEEGRKIDLKC
jgi:hypothetical protein